MAMNAPELTFRMPPGYDQRPELMHRKMFDLVNRYPSDFLRVYVADTTHVNSWADWEGHYRLRYGPTDVGDYGTEQSHIVYSAFRGKSIKVFQRELIYGDAWLHLGVHRMLQAFARMVISDRELIAKDYAVRTEDRFFYVATPRVSP